MRIVNDDFQERRRQGIHEALSSVPSHAMEPCFRIRGGFEDVDHVLLDKRAETKLGGLRGSSSLEIERDDQICTMQPPIQ